MSGLCGWTGDSQLNGSASKVITAMAEAMGRFDRSALQLKQHNRYAVAVAAPLQRASIAVEHGHVAAVWGVPRFNDDGLQQTARHRGAAIAVVEAFCQFGPDCCAKFQGPFAVAIVNEHTGETLLAIDRIGIHNLVYCSTGETLVYASNADSIRRFPGIAPEVDWQSIYNYVHFHMVPGPSTAFKNERRLLPGQYLHWRDGEVRLGYYWKMQFFENEERSFEELRAEFLSTLTTAVRRMSAGARTGAFLSGGTDSSTISGLLGRVTGQPAETFSIGFSEHGYDETSFARIAAQHFKTNQHEYYVTPADIVDAIPRLAEIFDQPFGNSSAVPTYRCARLAREAGMELVLGGDGGDELFGGNERYATQYLYSRYECIPRLMRTGFLEPSARFLQWGAAIPPIRWYLRLIELASAPMPDRMDAHNLLVRLGVENVFAREMLKGVETMMPRNIMRSVYQEANADSLINKMLSYDLQFTLADSDLPKVMKSCELAGLPVDFPMLDDELVSFSAHLAPHMKLNGTRLRYFFKEALRGFLPEEIITKTKHGFGLPFGPWLRTYKPLQELVSESFARLRSRGFVRTEFIDKLTGNLLQQHPGYYGTMAWILLMLEWWFRLKVDVGKAG